MLDDFDSLLEAAQVGAEWAFASLYREFNPLLLRYFGAHAPSVAEDLTSETWLAATRRLSSFRGDERDLRAWLFTIARRRMVQHWRETGRRGAYPVPPETLIDQPGSDDTEFEALDTVSAVSAARSIAEALSPDQADVVLLRVLAGLSVHQVAQVLGKRPATIRVLQHKALRRLAAKISPQSLTLR